MAEMAEDNHSYMVGVIVANNFGEEDNFDDFAAGIHEGEIIYLGGTNGSELRLEKFLIKGSEEYGITVIRFDTESNNANDIQTRNEAIIHDCDEVVFFMTDDDPLTVKAIEKAAAAGKFSALFFTRDTNPNKIAEILVRLNEIDKEREAGFHPHKYE